MWVLATALTASAFLLLLPAASGTCALNEGTNTSETPAPAFSFTGYRVYAGRDGEPREYVTSLPNLPMDTAGSISYVTTRKAFKVPSTGSDLAYGDLPWDEQLPGTCTRMKVGVPVKPCASVPPPTWGKPGPLVAANGGSCELETATKNLPNAEKYVNGFNKRVSSGWTHFGGLTNP
ncbi:hypothetical protein T492DRAFT_873991, partial [Pavlovales sp. CCMP2436]